VGEGGNLVCVKTLSSINKKNLNNKKLFQSPPPVISKIRSLIKTLHIGYDHNDMIEILTEFSHIGLAPLVKRCITNLRSPSLQA